MLRGTTLFRCPPPSKKCPADVIVLQRLVEPEGE